MENSKLEEAVSTRDRIVIGAIATLALATILYEGIIGEEREKEREKQTEIARQKYDSHNDKIRELLLLPLNVFNKAQYHDGKPGLSFEDQAQLVKNLGYEGVFIENQSLYFGGGLIVQRGKTTPLELFLEDKSGWNFFSTDFIEDYHFILSVSGDRFKVEEEKLRNY